ncbi:hypothetical protein QYM36_017079, partial [Artemia franciscana]
MMSLKEERAELRCRLFDYERKEESRVVPKYFPGLTTCLQDLVEADKMNPDSNLEVKISQLSQLIRSSALAYQSKEDELNQTISKMKHMLNTSEVGSTQYTETELYISARSDTRNYEPILDTISFKSCDSGSSKASDNNTIIEGLMVLYSNVDCITTKMNKIKLMISTRHEVSVFGFTEVKAKHTAFALTDTQIQVPGFELLTNLSKPNYRGIAVYIRSLLKQYYKNVLIVKDFNLLELQWIDGFAVTKGVENSNCPLLECLHEHLLYQAIDFLTRLNGSADSRFLEKKLRLLISKLDEERKSYDGLINVPEIPVESLADESKFGTAASTTDQNKEGVEMKVLIQEMMSLKEERAELRCRLFDYERKEESRVVP